MPSANSIPRLSHFSLLLPQSLLIDCICNGGFRPFSRFASGHLPYSVDLLRPALCLPLLISLRNLVYEVICASEGCLIFFEGTRRRRGCAEAGGWGRGNILLAELQIHSKGPRGPFQITEAFQTAFVTSSRFSRGVHSLQRPLHSESCAPSIAPVPPLCSLYVL